MSLLNYSPVFLGTVAVVGFLIYVWLFTLISGSKPSGCYWNLIKNISSFNSMEILLLLITIKDRKVIILLLKWVHPKETLHFYEVYFLGIIDIIIILLYCYHY